MAILEELRGICETLRLESEFVFTNTGKTPISGWAKAGPRLDRHIRAYLAELLEEERAALIVKGRVSPEMRQRKAAAIEKLEAVDLPHWRFHDLRHTVVTRMRGRRNYFRHSSRRLAAGGEP